MSQNLQIGSEGLSSTAAEIVAKMERGELGRLTAIAALQALLDSPQPTKSVATTSAMIPLAEMIVAAGIVESNKHIIAGNFPNDAFGSFDASGLVLFGGNRRYTTQEAEKEAKTQGKRLEGITQGLAYIKENPGALRDGPIVFAKATFKPKEALETLMVYARLEDGKPKLCLDWDSPTSAWPSRTYRFIASVINN